MESKGQLAPAFLPGAFQESWFRFRFRFRFTLDLDNISRQRGSCRFIINQLLSVSRCNIYNGSLLLLHWAHFTPIQVSFHVTWHCHWGCDARYVGM
jgi:hypothetical protein